MTNSPDDRTIVRPGSGPGSAIRSGGSPASDSGRSGSFVPGAVIASRYRLVALLGRGGMGEVYRADDLTLDQPVALKFLPPGIVPGAAELAQFHNELRTARQVSHKNVCRLYDLGEAEGRCFITMEYIDGEDLSSLVRRIGRVSQDKAVEMARQLCAGLAAAHDCGVIHRDLKPANVMIDGQGNVRITDFGLAMTTGDKSAVHAGTPAYMAPEQLQGHAASVQSDLYALGLVLFELFTGRRAHDAKSVEELRDWHDRKSVSSLSSVVRDIDPAIDRVIQRCLERDPARRPRSALAVAAALPGGDPLAAALAAGETPSPELVAAAGETEALHPGLGLLALAFIIAGLFAIAALADRTSLIARIPYDRSLDVLEDRAAEIVRSFGYVDPPADTARGILVTNEFTRWIARTNESPSRWDALATGSFPTIRFWYRTSPRPLVARELAPQFADPPLTTPGMVSATFDTLGRLTSLAAVPPPQDGAATRVATDWSKLFAAAGLAMDRFRPVTPTRTPSAFADERIAWDGPLHDREDVTVHLEGAAHEGRPVFFSMTGPWTASAATSPTAVPLLQAAGVSFATLLQILVWFGGFVLVRRHLRDGRADRQSGNRAFFVILGIWLLIWLFDSRHVMDIAWEWNSLLDHFPTYITNAGFFWLMYIALEPFARRYCPEMLFSWTRLMAGRLRDPRVGRDVLVGLSAAAVVVLWALAVQIVVPRLMGNAPIIPRNVNVQFLQGAGHAIARALRFAPNALQNTMLFTLVFVIARALTGRLWPAAVVTFAISILLSAGEGVTTTWNLISTMLFAVIFIGTLMRFGVIALATAWFAYFLLYQGPLTTDFTRVYGPTSGWLMLMLAALAAYGFYASRGGASLFGRLLPED